jgi:hypothetical protein
VKKWSLTVLLLVMALDVRGVERRTLKDVDLADMSRQLISMTQHDGMFAAIWWPPEFWAVALAREPGIPEETRTKILEDLGRYTLLGVVDARILPSGTFVFEPRDAVIRNTSIEWSGPKGRQRMVPLEEVPEDLRPLMQSLEPIMRSTLGELGRNLHVLVIADDAPTGRVMSPYEPGTLTFTLLPGARSAGKVLAIETPADALFVPRMCPNDKPAHVTWKVCPWDGSKLPD